MHAPNHLFCSGTFAPALAAAAWAGYLIAQGKPAEAEKWQETAVAEQGKAWLATCLMDRGQLEIRVIKGEVGVTDLEILIDLLQMHVKHHKNHEVQVNQKQEQLPKLEDDP